VLTSASSQRGISLVEILISIAIVAMVLAMAAPSSLVWIQNLQLRNAAESALAGIKMGISGLFERPITIDGNRRFSASRVDYGHKRHIKRTLAKV